MPDTPTFVVNDRRKFTAEGELRPEARSAEPTAETATSEPKGPHLVSEPVTPAVTTAELADLPESEAIGELYPDASGSLAVTETDAQTAVPDEGEMFPEDDSLPAGPSAEQAADAARAYEATVDRLETAMRAANPGGERVPPMSFERLVQSLYTQALILLGGGAQPGETPRVDILGARETIDMLAVLADKAQGNLSSNEHKLLDSALFDLRMGFLEITQALARQAAQRQGTTPGAPGGLGGGLPPMGGGPRIVR